MSKVILDYGGALDYGVPAGTYCSDPAGEIEALTAKLETAESEARRQMQHVAATLQKLEAAEKDVAYRQSVIDQLMLEYCPYEMTKEQLAEWSANQAPSDEDGPSLMDVLMLEDSHENKLATLLRPFDREALEKDAARLAHIESIAYQGVSRNHDISWRLRGLFGKDGQSFKQAIDAAIQKD